MDKNVHCPANGPSPSDKITGIAVMVMSKEVLVNVPLAGKVPLLEHVPPLSGPVVLPPSGFVGTMPESPHWAAQLLYVQSNAVISHVTVELEGGRQPARQLEPPLLSQPQ
jgi:hypothetical protein